MIHRNSLLRVLGVFFGLAVAVGITIGVGILRQPGPVAGYLRRPWLIMLMWFAGGVFALLGALNIAELATMIPRAGGFYVYARAAMGDTTGFAVGWSDYFGNVAGTAYAAMTLGEFATRIVPSASPYGVRIAIAAILSFSCLQWFGIRLSARVQQVAAATGAVCLIGLTVACLTLPVSPSPAAAALPPVPAITFFAALILAFQSIVVTYDGWYEPIYFAEESLDPGRHIPRAMFGGLAVIAGIYLLMNFALMRVMGPNGLAGSQFAAADAAKILFGPRGDLAIAVIGIVVVMTSLNVIMMTCTRILFAVSRDGLFSEVTARVASNGTPRHALAVSAAGAIVLILSGTVERLIAMAGFFFVANYAWGYVSLAVLRKKRPADARPFRVPLYPLLTVLVLAASIAFLVGAVVSDRQNSVYALILLAASYPVGRVLRARRLRLQ